MKSELEFQYTNDQEKIEDYLENLRDRMKKEIK